MNANVKDLKDWYRLGKYSDWILDHIPYGWRMHYKYHDVKLWFKSQYQILTKGYADKETWNLFYYTSKWILPRLQYLKDTTHGVPFNREKDFPEDTKMDDRTLTEDEWDERLDKMIFAFHYVINEDKYSDLCYPPNYKFGFKTDDKGQFIRDENGIKMADERSPDFSILEPYEKRYEEGMKLFALYFRDLWD
jgi:hypothetical protein